MKEIEDKKRFGKRKRHGGDNEDDDTELSIGVRKRVKGDSKGTGKRKGR